MRWLVIGLGWFGCRGSEQPPEVEDREYRVDVRTTTWGIPHILADDWFSAGVGVGYAIANDHVCTLADQFVKVNSRRARYHGPGDDEQHIDGDFGWAHLGIRAKAEATYSALPQDQRDAMEGWVTGYNRWLDDTPSDQVDPRCRGAEWLLPVDELDLYTYYLSLALLSSGGNFVVEVGQAVPPGFRSRRPPPPPASIVAERFGPEDRLGSNGWALGADRTERGGGLLLSNTHFPSEGEMQWWENHITIPGQVDVYGASLLGSIVPNLGFNEHVAWTHTVSLNPRFVVYELDLDPSDPTRYQHDGDDVAMTSETYTIDVLQADGTVATERRRLWRSQWGPIFNAPLVGWTTSKAFTWRDVNAENTNVLAVWLGMSQATSLEELKEAHRRTNGIPWVHTLVADARGNAFYTDSAATPNLSPEAWESYQTDILPGNLLAQVFAGNNIPVLRGSDPQYTLIEDPRAALPGVVPFDEAPQTERRDYVANANQNHWATNPAEPLEGFPPIYGAERAALSPRTKMNLRYLRPGDGAAGQDDRFSLEELEQAALSARGSMAEDLLAAVVERCTGADPVDVDIDGTARTVDVTEACEVLAAWDGIGRLDRAGAHVWREVVSNQSNEDGDIFDAGRLFEDAFDPANPVFTPSTLVRPDEDGDPILESLAYAVTNLEAAGVALDATLADVQYFVKGGNRYPRLGGNPREGYIATAIFSGRPDTLLPFEAPPPAVNERTGLQEGGYQVNHGNSFVMAAELTEDGPRARALLVYSQSENPESPHFVDQSKHYAEAQALRDVRFDEEAIASDPNLVTITLSSDDGG